MLEMVVAALEQVTGAVSLVGAPGWDVPDALSRLSRFDDEGGGAVQGVIAALRGVDAEYCVIVGCDMPFISPPLIRQFIDHAVQANHGVYGVDDGGEHPLHAVYRRRDLDSIEAQWASGERSLTRIVQTIGMIPCRVDETHAEEFRWSAFNVNTPAELAVARQRLRTMRGR